MHGAAHRLGRDEHVVPRRIEARHEAEAPRVHREQALALLAARRGGALRQVKPLARPRRQHALEAQVVEQPLEAQVVGLGDLEAGGNFARMERARFVVEEVEDVGAGREARGHMGVLPSTSVRNI